jgi:excisionase family DNA binding protein
MSHANTENLLTVAEAAQRLNVSQKTIRRLIASHELAVIRIGVAVRVHPKELQRYQTINWHDGQRSPSRTH